MTEGDFHLVPYYGKKLSFRLCSWKTVPVELKHNINKMIASKIFTYMVLLNVPKGHSWG